MALNTVVGSAACPASGDSTISLAAGFETPAGESMPELMMAPMRGQ